MEVLYSGKLARFLIGELAILLKFLSNISLRGHAREELVSKTSQFK